MPERISSAEAKDTVAIRSMLEQRMHLADVERSVMADKKSLNEKFQSYMDAHGYAGIQDETLGAVIKITQERESLDKDVLKAQLLLRGVATSVIAEAFAASTKSVSTTFIKYEAPEK